MTSQNTTKLKVTKDQKFINSSKSCHYYQSKKFEYFSYVYTVWEEYRDYSCEACGKYCTELVPSKDRQGW